MSSRAFESTTEYSLQLALLCLLTLLSAGCASNALETEVETQGSNGSRPVVSPETAPLRTTPESAPKLVNETGELPHVVAESESEYTSVPLRVVEATRSSLRIPSDISEHLSFFPGGGPGRCTFLPDSAPTSLSWYSYSITASHTTFFVPNNSPLDLCVLGVTPVTVGRIVYPDGRIEELSMESPGTHVNIPIHPEMQLGTYTLYFEQFNEQEFIYIDVVSTTDPSIVFVDEETIWLAGYENAEKVRLLLYRITEDAETGENGTTLIGELPVGVGASGAAILNISALELGSSLLVVASDETGDSVVQASTDDIGAVDTSHLFIENK